MSALLVRPPRPRPARAGRGLLGGLLAAGVLLTVVMGGALPAGAATTSAPSPSPTAGATGSSSELPVLVRVTDVAPAVLRPGEDLVVRATIRNTGAKEFAEPRATVRISRFLLSTRGALDQWEQSPATGAAGTSVESVALGAPLAPGAAADVEIRVPATKLRLSAAPAAWGPRGISLEVADAGRRQGLDRTFTLWFPTDAVTPTRLSVAVPLTGDAVDPAAAAAGAATPSDETLARLDDLVEVTADRPEVTWVVDPALLEAVATASTLAPDAAALERATRLAAAATGRDVFALGWLDPDLAALAHADAPDLAATATGLAASPALPLLGTPPRTDLAWPADAVPDEATVTLAARTGARAVVVGGDGLAAPDLSYTPTGRATVPTAAGDVAALVADPTLTDLLTQPTQRSAATAAQRLLAETAVIARERPSDLRHLLLAPGRSWQPDVQVARAQLAALAAAPWVALAPVSTLIGTADPGVERAALPAVSADKSELAPASIAALRAARAELATFASIVGDPTALVAGADEAVLAPVAVAARAAPRDRAVVVRDTIAGLGARRSGVSVVPGSGLLLISQSGTFPVGVSNELDQEIGVLVELVPANGLLLVDGVESVTVPARSQTQVRIPFHAVGSGDVRVEVTLLAPDGTAISTAVPFTARVRADWENVGTAVVAGVLGIAFLVGIVRTVRRGQTANRGATVAQIAEIAGPPKDRP